jgi:CDP-diacylglycerol--inositol 3-phosphatidyltransferase
MAVSRTRSKSTPRRKSVSAPNIYLYIPNLIGYFRVVLTLIAIYNAFTSWITFVVCYSVGAILDLFDGMAARHLNQSSKFGAVLDMVTDRVGTNMLYIVLAAMVPKYFFWIALLAGGDYASHWAQMYSAAAAGSHHKTLSTDRNWLLRFYYSNKPFMFLNCLGQETFLIAFYVYSSGSIVAVAYYVMLLSGPFGALKQFINVIQLADAMKQIAKIDVADLRK